MRDIDCHLFASLFTAPVIMRHVGRPLAPGAVSTAFDAVLAEMDRVPACRLYWTLATRDGADVGLISLSTGPGIGLAEMGIMLVSNAQGRGLAREACTALLAEVFRTSLVCSVLLRHRRGNAAMAALAGRLGFQSPDVEGGLCQWRLELAGWEGLARPQPCE
ncbi:RimJ/RimL family protein N-acetyltransferase [Luteimonas terrae]|uniref:RimJ/RimL family protein N-acetyltransferase n=1 Tax=Luteimonas terrae TaxID=1530191 RepID=A0ABU1XXI7_9GAMM|nr:RimJ/RimL family protein N-acetyltransferase [Luteimonas terrae]